MTHRTGLAGQTAASNRCIDVILRIPVSSDQRLADNQLQHRTSKICIKGFAIHGDTASTRAQPDAGDRIFTFAGCIGTAMFIELLHMYGSGFYSFAVRIHDVAQIFKRLQFFSHDQEAFLFLVFIAPTSSVTGCCAS